MRSSSAFRDIAISLARISGSWSSAMLASARKRGQFTLTYREPMPFDSRFIHHVWRKMRAPSSVIVSLSCCGRPDQRRPPPAPVRSRLTPVLDPTPRLSAADTLVVYRGELPFWPAQTHRGAFREKEVVWPAHRPEPGPALPDLRAGEPAV
jgi:hypothetical protein